MDNSPRLQPGAGEPNNMTSPEGAQDLGNLPLAPKPRHNNLTVAGEKQLEILRQGPGAWNAWRAKNQTVTIDLTRAEPQVSNLLCREP